MFHSIEKQIPSGFPRAHPTPYGIDLPVADRAAASRASSASWRCPSAFQLAKQLRQAPKKIAAELVAGDRPDRRRRRPGSRRQRLHQRPPRPRRLWRRAAAPASRAARQRLGEKIIVEHTNINPNKAAHIGHLRNAVLGDTFVRMLRAAGKRVEVQNYIDNTGVQVADVVVGLPLSREEDAGRRARADRAAARFDYLLLGPLRPHLALLQGPSRRRLQWRARDAARHRSGRRRARRDWRTSSPTPSCERHLTTMLRLGVEYDVLPRESEILHLKFWATAFELLKERKAHLLRDRGQEQGLLGDAGAALSTTTPDDEDDSKVIVRSNGTVTYVGKDIAYQLWKFGLLGKDFHYRPLAHVSPTATCSGSTTDEPQRAPAAVRQRRARLQRDRLAPVLPAGRGGRGTARARLRRAGRPARSTSPTRWWRSRRARCVELGIELSRGGQASARTSKCPAARASASRPTT